MLGTTRDIDLGVPNQSRERPADEGARVTRGGDVRIVEHGMAVTAQPPVVAGFRFAEQSNEPPARCRGQLASRIETKPPERGTHWLHVDRIFHDGMID